MDKLDLQRELKDEYIPCKNPRFVKPKAGQFLTISGEGQPGADDFKNRIGALYSIAYTIKMTKKLEQEQDYKVCGLEGLYWEKAGGGYTWKLMIRTPDFVKQPDLKAAVAKCLKKGKPAEVAEVALEKMKQGECVQMLHVGPYSTEPETMAKMKEFAGAAGKSIQPPHHEIYLSDPNRVKPEKLKTILRLRVA